MTLVSNIFNEVDELRGRLSSVMINYPDTEIRLKPAIEAIDILLTKPVEGTVMNTVVELIELRTYFSDILAKFPDLKRSFAPCIDLIDRLLGPTETVR